MKRTPEQITEIKKSFSDPFYISEFLSTDEIDYLENIFNTTDDTNSPYQSKIYKNTGPVTLDLQDYYQDSVIKSILEKLKIHIGNFEVTAAFFFKTDYPHVIHNDDTYELPNNVYKGITLPLKTYPAVKDQYPKLCFFDQYYYNGPAKFFFGDKDIPTFYNKQVYTYEEVQNLSNDPIPNDIVKEYFSHIKPQWLSGLSLKNTIDWIPGRAIIFDSLRLHAASDFRKLNINAKLGISIFTKKC